MSKDVASKISESPEELLRIKTCLVGHEPIVLISYINNKEKNTTLIKIWGTAVDAESGLDKIRQLQKAGKTQFDILLGDTRQWLKFPVEEKDIKEKRACDLENQRVIAAHINEQNDKMKELKTRMKILEGTKTNEDYFMALVRNEASKLLRQENYSETELKEKFRRFQENNASKNVDKKTKEKTKKIMEDIFSRVQ